VIELIYNEIFPNEIKLTQLSTLFDIVIPEEPIAGLTLDQTLLQLVYRPALLLNGPVFLPKQFVNFDRTFILFLPASLRTAFLLDQIFFEPQFGLLLSFSALSQDLESIR